MAEETQRTANVVLSADVDPYRQQVQAAGRDTQNLTAQVDKLTRSLEKLAKSAGNKLMIFGAGSAAGVAATTFAFAKFEKQMTSLRVASEVTGRSYEKMERDVNKLRKTYGITTDSAVRLQTTIQGFRDYTAPVEKLTDTFVKMGAATGEAPEQLARGMLQLQRTMALPQREADKLGNVFTDLSIKSGQSASSLIEFSNAIAPIGRIAGMSTAEIAGVSTAFVKAGQDGYTAANAFNKMLSDIMHATQSGSPDLAKYANLIGVTVGQFKDMGKTDAITRVFDEINRMGPDAIQVLNRLGLDGMRMQRAIAGVSSSSGGIGTAITQAVNAYNASGNNSLNKGAQVGLDGITDQMARLRESTAQFGETIGSNFEGPAKIMIGLLERMASAGNAIGGSFLGKMGSWALGVAAPLGLLVGGLLKMAPLLGTLALFRQAAVNFGTQGFRDVRNPDGGPSPSLRAIQRGDANFINRGMYSAGQFLGGVLPGGGGSGPGLMNRGMGAILRGGAVGLDMIRGGFSPLIHPFDPSRRVRFWATQNEPGIMSQSIMRGQTMGFNLGSRPGVFDGVSPNVGVLARSMTSFAGGLGGAAVGGGILAARGIGRVGGMVGSGLMGAMGGPWGLGLAAATTLPLALSSMNRSASLSGTLGAENGLTLMDAYNAAVGKATSSLQDFASALENARTKVPRSAGQASIVTDEDTAIAMAPGRKYTADGIQNLSTNQARMLAGSQWAGGDPRAIQEMKYDLIKAFGPDQAQAILAGAKSGGGFNVTSYMNDLFGTSTKLLGFKNGETDSQYKFLESELRRQSGDALSRGGTEASGLVTRANLNQVLQSFGGNVKSGNVSDAEYRRFSSFLNESYFGGNAEVGQTGFSDINVAKIGDTFAGKGTTSGLREFYSQVLSMEDSGGAGRELLAKLGYTPGQARKALGGSFASGLTATSTLGLRGMLGSTTTAGESFESRMRDSRVGRLIYNDPAINKALQPGNAENQNAQIQATDALVAAMRKQGMSYSQIDGALLRFQGAVQDTSDPLYQLAQSARAVAGQQLSFRIPYMSTAGRFGVAARGFGEREVALAPRPGENLTPDAAAQRKQNLQEFEAFKASTQQWLEQQYIQQREFNISMTRAQEDFGLTRARAEEDYNLSRARAEQSFAISRKDAYQDFAISRRRAEEDFHHQQELMVKQAAQSMANVYQRVLVQRTWSGSSLVTNAQDQLQRMQDQKANLDKIRGMGLSKNAIQIMGLGEFENEQQLKRLMEDIQNNPQLIAKLNKNMKGRLGAAKDLVTDSSNPQWEEMQRQFRISMERGQADFARGMARNKRNFSISMNQAAEDYDRSMDRMAADFDKSQKRAQRDLLRMQKEITWDLEKTLEKSADMFGGYIDKQVDEMLKNLKRLGIFLRDEMPRFFEDWELSPGVSQGGSTPLDRHDRGGVRSDALAANTRGKNVEMSGGTGGGRVIVNENGVTVENATVVSNDPDDMGRQLERKRRRERLRRGTL